MLVLDQEWNYLRATLEGLQSYLISDQLYGGLSLPASRIRSADFNRLTLGSLLLVLARLNAAPANEQHSGEDLVPLNKQVQDLKHRWQANWDRKSSQEIPVRLHSWERFLNEIRESPGQSLHAYPARVRERTMLELLISSMADHPLEAVASLNLLDQRLRGYLVQGNFIWEPELAHGFPPASFWFLYSQLKRV